jgi:hypothetical protein
MVPVVVNATKTPLDNECIRNKKSFTANAPYNEPSKDCHDETAAVCDQSDCRNSDGGNDDDTDDGDCDCSSSRESNSYSSNTLPPINQLYDYDSSSISENDDDDDDGDGSRSISGDGSDHDDRDHYGDHQGATSAEVKRTTGKKSTTVMYVSPLYQPQVGHKFALTTKSPLKSIQ